MPESQPSEASRTVPVTRIHEFVRRMVVRTSHFTVLHRVYAGIYRAAVRALVRELASNECTLSVFSRNSYAAGTFIPGRSDIDLAIVIRDDLAPSTVRTYLRNVFARCERLRRPFPMLNQFPVYTRRGFIEAYRLGPLRLETDSWRCEWGEAELLSQLGKPAVLPPLEAVSRVVQIYLNGFHANLRTALRAGHVRSTLAMERSASKIERALRCASPVGDLSTPGTISEVVARLMTATTGAVDRSALESYPPHRWATVPPQEQCSMDVVVDSEPVSTGVVGTVLTRNGSAAAYVLAAPVTAEAVENALGMARAQTAESNQVMFTTAPLLTFFVRHINPMLYYQLATARNVRGDDVMARIPAPSQAGIRWFFRSEAAHMLRLSTRLGAEEPPSRAQLMVHERRRARLFHFLRHQEILLDGRASGSTANRPPPKPRDLLRVILDDMPRVMDELRDHAALLLIQSEAETPDNAP